MGFFDDLVPPDDEYSLVETASQAALRQRPLEDKETIEEFIARRRALRSAADQRIAQGDPGTPTPRQVARKALFGDRVPNVLATAPEHARDFLRRQRDEGIDAVDQAQRAQEAATEARLREPTRAEKMGMLLPPQSIQDALGPFTAGSIPPTESVEATGMEPGLLRNIRDFGPLPYPRARGAMAGVQQPKNFPLTYNETISPGHSTAVAMRENPEAVEALRQNIADHLGRDPQPETIRRMLARPQFNEAPRPRPGAPIFVKVKE